MRRREAPFSPHRWKYQQPAWLKGIAAEQFAAWAECDKRLLAQCPDSVVFAAESRALEERWIHFH